MKSLFNLKTWQVFIVLIFNTILIVGATTLNVSIGDLSIIQIVELFRILGLIVFTLWLFLVGIGLNRIENNPYKFNNILLTVAAVCFFTGYASMSQVQFPGFEHAIPLTFQILTMPFTLFGIGYLFYNIPMSLKSAEMKKRAKFSDCILDVLLFFSCAAGIGIWWLQPRLRRLTG